MEETHIVKCPKCNKAQQEDIYDLTDTSDMEGQFEHQCDACKETFTVRFEMAMYVGTYSKQIKLKEDVFMTYTPEQIQVFERMFSISSEHTCYTHHVLTANGLEEQAPGDLSYNTGRGYILLSNNNEYAIDYGDSGDAEGHTLDAFQKFIELDFNEELFEQYLINESSFHPA